MEAGRELDALVAEKVMGKTVATDGGGHWDFYEHGAGDASRKLPTYSTDIAAAWEVVEKIKGRFRNFSLSYSPPHNGFSHEWNAADVQDDHGPSIYESADTAPHAICLAALAATADKR